MREAVASAPAPPPAPRRRRRIRWKVVAIVAVCLLVLAGVTVGAAAAIRNVYFIGQDDRGLVTLYRGLPYELPVRHQALRQRVRELGSGAARCDRSSGGGCSTTSFADATDAAELIRTLEQGQMSARAPRALGTVPGRRSLITAGFTAVYVARQSELGSATLTYGGIFLALCLSRAPVHPLHAARTPTRTCSRSSRCSRRSGW